jgi:hypothetical protein
MRLCVAAAVATLAAGLLIAAFVPTAKLNRIGAIDTGSAIDIAIFRCAALIVGAGDPYTIEPLATCERRTPAIFAATTTAPAPQPPFVLDLFKPFATIPETRFAVGWLAVNLALALAASGLLSAVSKFPAPAIVLCLIWGPGFDTLVLGQLAMVLLFAVSWSAYELQRGRPRVAACVLSLAMIEPHVGLPAFVALFVIEPRARATIAALFAAGLCWTLVLSGPSIAWEYASRMLPLQALAEATNPSQYSLTFLAYALGAGAPLAVRLGELQYVLFVGLSIALANRMRTRFAEPAFIVAVPVAVSVIGGPYIHFVQTIALWPLVLLVARYSRGNQRVAAAVLVTILAVPWRSGAWLKLDVVFDVSEAIIVWTFLAGTAPIRRIVTFFAILVPTVVAHTFVSVSSTRPFLNLRPAASLSAEAPWGLALSPIPWGTFIRAHWTFVSLHELYPHIAMAVTIALLAGLMVALGSPGLDDRFRTMFKKGSVPLRA